MNAYRLQQLRAAALIEQGATAEQVAAVYGWTKSRAAPEPIETGDKRTLTRSGKCGIIKAIRRHVRRWKRKQEGKTMKTYALYMTAETGERFALCENGWDIGSTYTVNATSAAAAADIFAANVDIDLTGDEYAAEISPREIAERPHNFTPLPIW